MYSSCYDCENTIRIVVETPVDKSKKAYVIPRGLLMWHSAYFAAALDFDSDFAAGEELCLEEHHEVFNAFVCWLFTGRVKDPHLNRESETAHDHFLGDETIFRLWIFADMRGIPGLGNAAIDMYDKRIGAT